MRPISIIAITILSLLDLNYSDVHILDITMGASSERAPLTR